MIGLAKQLSQRNLSGYFSLLQRLVKEKRCKRSWLIAQKALLIA